MAYSDVQFHKDLINGLEAIVKSLNGIRSELRTLNNTISKFESGFYIPTYGDPIPSELNTKLAEEEVEE